MYMKRPENVETRQLTYDENKWYEEYPIPTNTLQMFITGACNLRCPACFFRKHYKTGVMDLDTYKSYVEPLAGLGEIGKVIILGGEPTLHPDLPKMIEFNNSLGLNTTLYTNGHRLHQLYNVDLRSTSIRVSICDKDKPLRNMLAKSFTLPNLIFVYMLARGNEDGLLRSANEVEYFFRSKAFYISSIRDIVVSGNYWIDTPDTLSFVEHGDIVQKFLDTYTGKMDLHISKRGFLTTKYKRNEVKYCRFMNILPDESKIICPFDICKNITIDYIWFGQRPCMQNAGCGCLLQKIVLKRTRYGQLIKETE